jgi:beta-galactosidase GanA
LTLNFYSQVTAAALDYFLMFGYDLRSESHFVNWIWLIDLPGVQYCYRKNTQKRFRQWLKTKYGSLSELNEVCYRTFEDWEQVEGPRFDAILSDDDFMLWLTFTTDKLAQDLHIKAQTVSSVDKNHVTTSHSGSPFVINTPWL